MKEERYFYAPEADTAGELPAEEAVHAVRVLRLKEGDELWLMDGRGSFYRAEVTVATGKRCLYAIRERVRPERTWAGRIHIAMAPTKMMERTEWMAEKATEVGFDRLTPLLCQFSERRTLNAQRLDKIIVSAMKQSRKPYKPVLDEMTAFSSFVSAPREGRKFIAHCYDEIPRQDLFACLQHGDAAEPCTVMIGPEGDFSIDEVRQAQDCGFQSVSLGSSRLRTETAALMAVTMMQLLRRNK